MNTLTKLQYKLGRILQTELRSVASDSDFQEALNDILGKNNHILSYDFDEAAAPNGSDVLSVCTLTLSIRYGEVQLQFKVSDAAYLKYEDAQDALKCEAASLRLKQRARGLLISDIDDFLEGEN